MSAPLQGWLDLFREVERRMIAGAEFGFPYVWISDAIAILERVESSQ